MDRSERSSPADHVPPSGRTLNRRGFLQTTVLTGLALGASGCGAMARRGDERDNLEPTERAVYLTDLQNAQPASALAAESRRGVWRMLPYTSHPLPDGRTISGTLLAATTTSDAPMITLPLGRLGWHRVYVGVYRKPFAQAKEVQVRLTRDTAFTFLEGRAGDKDHQANWIDDIYWRTADLTGQDIVLRQTLLPDPKECWVGYIKLIPLSEAEIDVLKKDQARFDTKRLFVHSDAHFLNVTGSELEVQNKLEPFRNTDVSRIYWEAGSGDTALYFSKILRDYGTPLREAADREAVYYAHDHYRQLGETWVRYREKGVDPLRVAAEYAREAGLEFHASYRVGGFAYPPPLDNYSGDFLTNHPELRCVARDGRPVPRLSYAYPETRRFVISLFREMAQYPIDGVCLLYNRRPPLVGYETRLINGFRDQYGEDPRHIDEDDPRWLAYRATALNAFMRELRTALDDEAAKQGRKRLEVSAVVPRFEENLQHGMDLALWIEEGLVDTIIPYSSSVRLNSFVPSWDDRADVTPFVKLVRNTKCTLAFNLMPRNLRPEGYRRLAHSLYRAGAENFFFWDGIRRARNALRLGHKDEVEEWVRDGEPPILPAATSLARLAGWDLKWETPG